MSQTLPRQKNATLYFATSNQGKIKQMQRICAKHDITVEGIDLPLIEPQFDTIAEIARFKASQAFEAVKGPIVVHDAGLFIEAFDGFPGPYMKYSIERLGVDGFLNLMQGQENRACHFISVLAYADERGEVHVFEDHNSRGSIAFEKHNGPLDPGAWSEFSRIFKPFGCDKTLNEMTQEERDSWYLNERGPTAFDDFMAWLGAQPRSASERKAKIRA